MKHKTTFFYFAGLIVLFIISAILLGQYHSPLALIIGYFGGFGVTYAVDRWIDTPGG